MPPLILASGSPRRRELLSVLGFDFEVLFHDVDEEGLDYLPPPERVRALALAKARSVGAEARARGALVLGADTLVCDPEPLGAMPEGLLDASGSLTFGKPGDREGARLMLGLLAGRTHRVHTGLALLDARDGREESLVSTSLVRFAPMSADEIEALLDTGEWEGVAGAYRIQGLAACFIEEIRGSWSGIVGLPIRELYAILTRLEIETPALGSVKFPPFGAR